MNRYTSDYKVNSAVLDAVKKHWDSIAKPLHGLGAFEDIIIQIGEITQCDPPDFSKRAALVFLADNGVIEEGVAQSDQEVTQKVCESMMNSTATINTLSKFCNADVFLYDVGMKLSPEGHGIINLNDKKVAWGTKNFAKEPAMSPDELHQAIKAGWDAVLECKNRGYNIISAGEMGIGNTTTSTAVAISLLCNKAYWKNPENVEEFSEALVKRLTGHGAGATNQIMKNKTTTIYNAIKKYNLTERSVEDILQHVGGFDIAAMAGVYLAACRFRIPVIMDGLISAAAALAAVCIEPNVRNIIVPSHLGKEQCMQAVVNRLGLSPVVHADMALGEGTGCMFLYPLLDMAMEVYRAQVNFDVIGVEQYGDGSFATRSALL